MRRQHSIFFAAILIFALLILPVYSAQMAAAQDTTTLENTFDELSNAFGVSSPQMRLITDNNEAWYARWKLISNAKNTIDVTSFIVDRDAFGMALLGLFQKKASEGVKIRFMIDARGAGDLAKKFKSQDYLQELVEMPNVTIHVYNPLSQNILKLFLNPRNIICSNHDKIIIVDDEWVITGGRNLARNYFASHEDVQEDIYYDTDILMKGKEIASKMKTAFEDEFNAHYNFNVKKDFFVNFVSRASELEIARMAMEKQMTGRGLISPDNIKDERSREALINLNKELETYKSMVNYSNYQPFYGDRSYPAIVLDKHSFKGTLNNITPAIVKLIKSAQKEIIIQNPYFVVTDEAMAALREANSRGVSIIILTNSPDTSEKPFTLAFFVGEWQKLLVNLDRARLFAFRSEGKLHSKVMVFDRQLAIVSSYNMDPMSEQINSEIAVLIKSTDFSTRSALRVQEMVKKSGEYKIKFKKDGTIQPIFGPESDSSAETLKKLKDLYKLTFLRPLI